MSEVAHAFSEWYDEVSRKSDSKLLPDDIQVNIRVNEMVAAGLDALGRELGASRAAVARVILEAGIHDAMKVGGLVFCLCKDDWIVVSKDADCPEGYRRIPGAL